MLPVPVLCDLPRWHGIASCYGMEHALTTLRIYPDLVTSNRYAHGGRVEASQYRKQIYRSSAREVLINNWNGRVNHICITASDVYLLMDKFVSNAWTVRRVSTSLWMQASRRGSSILFVDRTMTVTMHGIDFFLSIRDCHYNQLETIIVTISLLSYQNCFHYCYCYYCYCPSHSHCHSHCWGHCHCHLSLLLSLLLLKRLQLYWGFY